MNTQSRPARPATCQDALDAPAHQADPGNPAFEIFLAAPPGLEPLVADEAAALGLPAPRAVPGGVTLQGGWPEVWRANLHLRGASRVLARIAEFRALHLAQLDKRARKLPWADTLRPDVPLRIEATCHRSPHLPRRRRPPAHRHRDRARPWAPRSFNAGPDDPPDDAVTVRVRIDDDLCTISLDTSGAPLHRRGHKQAVGAAPMRETLAALFLRACGYDGAEPVLDPMCGSGTFVLEAAEIAAGLAPGRTRPFAFQRLATFDPAAWDALKAAAAPNPTPFRFHGRDRDAGAIEMSPRKRRPRRRHRPHRLPRRPDQRPDPARRPARPRHRQPALRRPPRRPRRPPPPLRRPRRSPEARFPGWRVGLVTTEPSLAHATGLPFAPPGPPVPHGPLKVRLWQTEPSV